MGCFNSIMVPCPRCGEKAELQSKAGSCSMRVDPPETAELTDLAYVAGENIQCEECDTVFAISVQYMVSVK